MKVLFVPVGGASHEIPMYVLYKRYFSNLKNTKCIFLLPKISHLLFKQQNVDVFDFDYTFPKLKDIEQNKESIFKKFKEEEDIIINFKPDLVIECLSLNTAAICKKYNIPRVSIHRTGFFRSTNPLNRNSAHLHSIEKDSYFSNNYSVFQYKKVTELNYTDDELYYIPKLNINFNGIECDYLDCEVKLVPGISTIEKLPKVKSLNSYKFCGPLIANDNPTLILKQKIEDFFENNKHRKKVFITTGLLEKQDVSKIIGLLLDKNYAVITTSFQEVDIKHKIRFFYNTIMPLNFVCSYVDLIIHHCGSGIYHYPLLNLKPSITMGTLCYDREDVALQLELLGISAHTPSPFEKQNYMDIFESNLEKFEKGSLSNLDKMINLRNEIVDTMLNFDVNTLIEEAISSKLK